jgi:starvation-inducible DNA-binding protein
VTRTATVLQHRGAAAPWPVTTERGEEKRMSEIRSRLPEDVRKTVGEALQGAVVDLVDLGLVAKQVHWTVVGREFRSVHLQLDDVVATARQYSDTLAERAVAIGVLPDGRATALLEQSGLPQPPLAWVPAGEAIGFFVRALDEVVERMRERIDGTRDDPVSQDLVIEVTGALEKHLWMWQAESQAR